MQMSTNSLLVQINATACFAIGWPVNLLLIWLIVYRTSQELRVWSRVLLQSAILDLGLSLFAFLNQYELISKNGVIYYKMNGPHQYSSLTTKQCLTYSFLLWQEFSRHAIAVQFAYRWLVICREKHVSNKFYTLMLLLPFIVASIEILFMLFNRILDCHDDCESNGEYIFLGSNETISSLIANALFQIFNTITMGCIITCTWLCWRKTRQGLMAQDARSRKINRQVSIVLIAQAVYPLGLTMIPITAVALFVAMGMPIPAWLSLLVTHVWNTVVYPMIAILVIGHYRRSLTKMLGFKRRSIVASSGTQHVRQATVGNWIRNDGRPNVS